MAAKEKINLLEVIPCRSEHITAEREGETIVLSFPRFKYPWMQRFLVPKGMSKELHVKLEEHGTAVWELIDEEKGVYNEDGSMNLNPNSLTVLKDCYVEPNFEDAKAYDSFQFVRQGYFCIDAKDSREDALVFNRIVSLKSSFKITK